MPAGLSEDVARGGGSPGVYRAASGRAQPAGEGSVRRGSRSIELGTREESRGTEFRSTCGHTRFRCRMPLLAQARSACEAAQARTDRHETTERDSTARRGPRRGPSSRHGGRRPRRGRAGCSICRAGELGETTWGFRDSASRWRRRLRRGCLAVAGGCCGGGSGPPPVRQRGLRESAGRGAR